jgi:alkylated DNA repair dioxygenase AlkB
VPELVPATNPDLVQVDYGIDSDATTEFEEEIEACIPETISQEQQVLWNITEQLFAIRKSNLTKPAPAGQPEVWAEGRQELCETLHYFRSYQSACYATGGYVRGFMFDKVAHARDYIDSDVVISRAGGGLSKDKESGEMRSSQDQTDDTPIVQALKNCMKHYNPVVVITGVDNPHVPSQPPHQYCVLDYFKPTHIWFEKSGNSKILRYRFEKLNTQKESWWRPENEQEIVELGALGPPVESICECCGETSQQIYFNGWMCLQPNCSAFWHIANGSSLGSHKLSYEPDEGSLVYDPRFLKQKTPWLNDNSDYPLSFNTTELSGYSVMGEDVSQAFWAGIVCPDCGKCNSRLGWTGWDCSNPTCRFSKEPPHSLIPAKSLRDPFWPLTADYPLSRDTHAPLINVDVSFAHGYRINRYNIPGLDGFITHMIANKTVVEEPGGPDTMFEELQQTDIDLRRRAMPNGQLKGESYCRHFSVNYGMPYKFIASTASHSFFDAACPITATRSRLNWAAKHLLSQAPSSDTSMQEEEEEKTSDWDENKEFNEVLALGYFESQKINYHDDGEFGLGPTIATLSLGAAGTMRIRMKSRHYHGCSAAGVYDDSTPLPGSQQYESRLALHADLQALKKRDVRAYRARLKQIPRELKLKSSGNAKDVLRMEVGHGDVVVMHGREVQKYYEHAVEHGGKLRFALTCRYIDPESLSEADRPGYTVGRDEGGYDGAKVC